jgi:undecaprenyl-diphosphatase
VDVSGVHTLNQLFVHNDWLEDPILRYDSAALWLYLGMLIAVIACAVGVRRAGWRRAAVAAGLSAGAALAVGKLISDAVNRQRPFEAHPRLVHLFEPHALDPGFPSDHATAAFAIGVALVLRSRVWGMIVLAFAALLGFARIALGYHYPSDVLAGALLGSAAALALWSPAPRRIIDRISDALGGLWDRALGRVLAAGHEMRAR